MRSSAAAAMADVKPRKRYLLGYAPRMRRLFCAFRNRLTVQSAAPCTRDLEYRVAQEAERLDIDPFDGGVRTLAHRPEEHSRDPRLGDQCGVGPERCAD